MTAPQPPAQPAPPPIPPWLAGLGVIILLTLGIGVATQATQQNNTTTTTTTTAAATTSTVKATTVAPTTRPATTAAPPTAAPTTTPPAGAVTVRPSGGDDTPALIAAITANAQVVIDQPLRLDNVLKITTSNRTITWTGNGSLVRSSTTNPAKPTDTRTFQGIWVC